LCEGKEGGKRKGEEGETVFTILIGKKKGEEGLLIPPFLERERKKGQSGFPGKKKKKKEKTRGETLVSAGAPDEAGEKREGKGEQGSPKSLWWPKKRRKLM